jgi:hypothetical protein
MNYFISENSNLALPVSGAESDPKTLSRHRFSQDIGNVHRISRRHQALDSSLPGDDYLTFRQSLFGNRTTNLPVEVVCPGTPREPHQDCWLNIQASDSFGLIAGQVAIRDSDPALVVSLFLHVLIPDLQSEMFISNFSSQLGVTDFRHF